MSSTTRLFRIGAATLALGLATTLSACGSSDPTAAPSASGGGQTVVVGSFAFPESEILGEIYAQALEAKGVTENAALVGFSMGGGEVARYMSRHGGRGVTQAAFVASVVPHLLKSKENPDGLSEAQLDKMSEQMKADRADFFASFFKDFYGVGLVSHPVSQAQINASWNVAMTASLQATLKAAEAFGTTDFTGDLASITVPTLIIHGTADKTVPIDATARPLSKALPHARLLEYDGAPHGLFASHKERFTADLLSFLFVSFFAWKSITLLLEALADGQTTPSAWGPPLWIPYGCMSAGMVLLAVQLLLQVLSSRHRDSQPAHLAPSPH